MRKKIKLFLISFVIVTTTFSGLAIYSFLKSRKKLMIKRNRLSSLLSEKKRINYLFEAATIYLGNRYEPTWIKGIQPSKDDIRQQRAFFGYNLGIEHIIDTNPATIKNEKHVTIYFHGWGDHRNSARLLKAFCDVLPGDLISFNFKDRGMLLAPVHQSSFGQLPDVLPALYVLSWAKRNLPISAFDLFGYSRGGATVVNLIAVLNDKTGIYDVALNRIGIDAKERQELLAMIQRGSLVLDCSLIDMNVTINEFFTFISPKFITNLLEKFSKYDRNGLQALQSAQSFADLKLKTLIHFQHKDSIVSNQKESEFYKAIAQHNPADTYLVLGNDGGHLHTHESLAHALHAFRKKYSGAYDPEYIESYSITRGFHTIASKLLRPRFKAVESVINNFYTACCGDKKKSKNKISTT